MADIEFPVIHRLCTNRRTSDVNTLKRELTAFGSMHLTMY